MSRQAVEKLVGRMYREAVRSTGRLPSGNDARQMEKKAAKIAEKVSREKKK